MIPNVHGKEKKTLNKIKSLIDCKAAKSYISELEYKADTLMCISIYFLVTKNIPKEWKIHCNIPKEWKKTTKIACCPNQTNSSSSFFDKKTISFLFYVFFCLEFILCYLVHKLYVKNTRLSIIDVVFVTDNWCIQIILFIYI